MLKKEVVHPVLGKIIYVKNPKSRSIRVTVRAGKGLHVSLPTYCTYNEAELFVDRNRERVAEMMKRVEQKINARESVKPADSRSLEETAKRARAVLPGLLAELSGRMNEHCKIKDNRGGDLTAPFSYNRLFLKNNVSNWGSCSVKKNINLNINLVNLPEHLMRYVILHELCHLVYMNHSSEFHTLLNSVCGGKERELARQLKEYTLRK